MYRGNKRKFYNLEPGQFYYNELIYSHEEYYAITCGIQSGTIFADYSAHRNLPYDKRFYKILEVKSTKDFAADRAANKLYELCTFKISS